jgi:site-specific recombinase XerC
MKQSAEKYLQYLSSVRNSSPHTILNYGKDLSQFLEYLSPPGAQPPALNQITHTIIREFVAHLHDQGLEKSSIARKLAALRSSAVGAHAEAAKTHPVGIVGRRDERFPESPRRYGGSRSDCGRWIELSL